MRRFRLTEPLVMLAIVAVNEQQGKMPFRTMWIKPVAVLVTSAIRSECG
jgi:hypothetical protein